MITQNLGSQDHDDAVKQLLRVTQSATRWVSRLQQARSKRPAAQGSAIWYLKEWHKCRSHKRRAPELLAITSIPLWWSEFTHLIWYCYESYEVKWLYNIWGSHGCDYEECRLLRYRNQLRTSQETHYVSATEPSRVILGKIWRVSRRWLWRMSSSGVLRHVALVRTDVSDERSASIIRITRISELGTLAVTRNRRTLRRNTTKYYY
jgi:hypothetical protein